MKLTSRQKREASYFDGYAEEMDVEKLLGLPLFSEHAFENRYVLKALGGMEGLHVLDVGCGWGEDAVWFGGQGAYVFAIDISGNSLFLARQLASRKGVGARVRFMKAAAEYLPFNDCSFDVIFGRGTLHHVEVAGALKEVYRVLKPGGVACFSEPLADNPILNIYRRINMEFRSPTEKPIRYAELGIIKSYFDAFEHREFKLLAMIVLFWYYVKTKLSGTFHTGWFRDLDSGLACRKAYHFFQKLDNRLISLFPWLGRWCWLTVIVGRKC